jgi:hypothetical protein
VKIKMGEQLNPSGKDTEQDTKAKMLAALAKKQKGNTPVKNQGSATGSKIGTGQTGGSAPKMHRRKAGSA